MLAPLRRALVAAFGSRSGVPHWFEMRTDHGPQYTGGDCELMCKEWGVVHLCAGRAPDRQRRRRAPHA